MNEQDYYFCYKGVHCNKDRSKYIQILTAAGCTEDPSASKGLADLVGWGNACRGNACCGNVGCGNVGIDCIMHISKENKLMHTEA